MYKKILVTLDHSKSDAAILEHIEKLQKLLRSELILLHVADGWAARNYHHLDLKESEEILRDKNYLNEIAETLQKKGISVKTHLAMGDPAKEIVQFARSHDCDLIAMSTHGHRFFADLMLGTTADKVRHEVNIPVLLLRAS